MTQVTKLASQEHAWYHLVTPRSIANRNIKFSFTLLPLNTAIGQIQVLAEVESSILALMMCRTDFKEFTLNEFLLFCFPCIN